MWVGFGLAGIEGFTPGEGSGDLTPTLLVMGHVVVHGASRSACNGADCRLNSTKPRHQEVRGNSVWPVRPTSVAAHRAVLSLAKSLGSRARPLIVLSDGQVLRFELSAPPR